MEKIEAINYIMENKWFGKKPGLERIRELLSMIGDPQKSLKFIHIAGTNGKGSCAAMCAAVMKAAGYKTGLFTSPYLYKFNERMQINGKQIEDDDLAEIVEKIKSAAEKMAEHPTTFELITATALEWFAKEKCDIVILEVGLGGRYDATNIIESSEAAVIMNIGLDHTEILGDTIEKIAKEKAGIIKKNSSVILYQQSDEAEAVIKEECSRQNAAVRTTDFSQIELQFDSLEGQTFTYKGNEYAIPLLGAHQRKNASAVIETMEVMREKGWNISQDSLEYGMYSTFWPARFEVLCDDPYFVLDGGHNPQCATTVVENLADYFPGQKHILLVGVLKDKDYDKLFTILNLAADEYFCVTPESDRALDARELAKHLEKYGKKVTVCENIDDAVFDAMDRARETEGMVCAVGSLYISGKIRDCFGLY